MSNKMTAAEALEAVERYEKFIDMVLAAVWNSTCEMQDEAEECGIIAPVEGGYDPEKHASEHADCLEPGDPFYMQVPEYSVMPTLRAAVEERDKLEEVGNDVLDDLTIAQNANAALRSELASAEARAEEAERAGLEVCAATDEWVAANDALRAELARWRDAVREAFACDDGAPVEPADVARLVQACDVETRADLARMMAELQAKWDAALSPATPQEGE